MGFAGAVKMDDVAGGDGVSGVDFSDEKRALVWLEHQTVETRCAIASRSALRAFSSIILLGKKRRQILPYLYFGQSLHARLLT